MLLPTIVISQWPRFHNLIKKKCVIHLLIRLDWDRWIMMGIIGFLVGIVGFLNGQLIHLITETKWEHGIDYISKVKSLHATPPSSVST